MDVIAGFPTETEELFAESYLLLAETPWTRLHVFPYSVRQGTRAAVMPPVVTPQEKKARARRLRELSESRLLREAHRQVGSLKSALMLKDSERPMGLSRDYWNIRLDEVGTLATIDEVLVRINSVDFNQAGVLHGSLA
jgi:threonylcarbamoyladenosine tRNA methylthiotransferase MtaB